jgi:DNA-binding NarL/FixJ family response regulator
MINVRVSIYEDNALLRESVASLLRLKEGIHVLEAYENVLCIEEQIKKDKPDLVLMDIDMPGMNGIEAVKKIRSFDDRVAILMLTVFDDNHHVFDAICAGASGYLLKKHISSRLFDSIDEMLSGGAPMSPSIARMVISSMQHGARDLNPYSLTPREREMLTSLSDGNSYKLIALEFSISIDTVRTHIKKIYEKLHVHSQTEAVAKALKEKLV